MLNKFLVLALLFIVGGTAHALSKSRTDLYPATASFVMVKMTDKKGRSEETVLGSALHKAGEKRIDVNQVLLLDYVDSTRILITLSMEYRVIGKNVALPVVRVSTQTGTLVDGFSPLSSASTLPIPAVEGQSAELSGVTFEITGIEDQPMNERQARRALTFRAAPKMIECSQQNEYKDVSRCMRHTAELHQ